MREWRSYGVLPVAAALGYATAVIHIFAIGPFFGPLQAEFGWSRAEISSGLTLAAFLTGLFGIPIGLLVDRVGPRLIGLIGVVLLASSFALLGTASGSRANWIFLWVLIAIGTLGVHATVWTAAVTSRFEVSRGLALAVTLSGGSIGAAVFPILATWLVSTQGWRTAFPMMSALWLAGVLPILLLFFRGAKDRARNATVDPAAAGVVLTGVSVAEGLRSPALRKLLVAGGAYAFTTIGATVHFVPILTDQGAQPLAAAGIAALIGISSIFGRLGTGLLLDRLPGHWVGACGCLLPVTAAALLLLDGTNPVSQTLAAIALGLTLGSEVDVIAYLASKHFGLKNFGALYGALIMALSLGTAFGPLAAGAVYDHFGGYAEFLMLTAALMGLSAVALLSLGHAPAVPGGAPETPTPSRTSESNC